MTDSGRNWNETKTGSRSQTVYKWSDIPLQYHAGWETGRAATLDGAIIKGAGEKGKWAYVICLENPILVTVINCKAWGGARTASNLVAASWEAGPWRNSPIPNYPAPVGAYDPEGMNYQARNDYLPGVWGDYTPSPYDPR